MEPSAERMIQTEQNHQIKSLGIQIREAPYLELLLEFTVQPSQHCICLFIFADSSLNSLLLLGRLSTKKYKQFSEIELRGLDPEPLPEISDSQEELN